MSRARQILIASLVVGAAGSQLARLAAPIEPGLAPGLVILGASAALVYLRPSRPAGLLAAAGAIAVLARVLAGGDLDALAGSYVIPLAIGRTLQITGSLLAAVLGLVLAARRSPRRTAPQQHGDAGPGRARTRADRRALVGQVAALLVLSAVGAELLAAYDDSTGHIGRIAFAIVFFGALYGCPALLIREVARRTDRGWRAMLPLGAALGLLQAGIIDQSLFSEDFGDVCSWDETTRATYIAPLGIGAHNTQNFILGHLAFSFCAPIAIAEALRPQTAPRP